MSKLVVVTGAFGQVGRRAIEHLLAAGHRVIAVDLKTAKSASVAATFDSRVEILWSDICDPGVWLGTLEHADAVLHIAAIIPPSVDRNPARAIAVNQKATANLVRWMESSRSAKRLVFASSAGVAGNEQHRRTPPLTVDEAPCATDLYGLTKIEAERSVQASALRWSILRLGVVVAGRSSFGDAANLDAMWNASAAGRVEVVHDDDAGLAFARAVDCEAAVGKILYIGGGESCRSFVQAFYDRFLGAVGLGPLNPRALRPGAPYFYGDWLDTDESQRLLGYQRHSLDDILESRARSFGVKRLLIKPLAPLINTIIAKRSPHMASG